MMIRLVGKGVSSLAPDWSDIPARRQAQKPHQSDKGRDHRPRGQGHRYASEGGGSRLVFVEASTRGGPFAERGWSAYGVLSMDSSPTSTLTLETGGARQHCKGTARLKEETDNFSQFFC